MQNGSDADQPSGYPPYPHEPGVRYTASGWTIKKQINYGDLIGMLAVVVPLSIALISWSNALKQQIVVNDQRIEQQEQKNIQQDQRIDRMEMRTDRALQSVESKLDKMNENLLEHMRRADQRGDE